MKRSEGKRKNRNLCIEMTVVLLVVLWIASCVVWADAEGEATKSNAVSCIKVVNMKNVQDASSSEYGSYGVLRNIEMGDETFELYPEFVNGEDAMKKITEQEDEALKYLVKKYGIEPLCNDNYEEYRGYVMELFESPEITEDMEDALSRIDVFLDIYENKDKNDQIQSITDDISKAMDANRNPKVEESVDILNDVLPYNLSVAYAGEGSKALKVESFSTKTDSSIELTAETSKHLGNSKFDVEKGISYAKKYAPEGKHNPKYHYFTGRDCTNFVSQIKKAGGVPFHYAYIGTVNPTIDKKKSWYYKSKDNYGHYWTVADKFAKFFEVKYTTTSFMNLSKKVKKGSFITKDASNDKDWDHMAFVTATTSKKKTTEGVTYYDFKIAQHTSDYHLYVSSKDCGWDRIKKSNPKAVFGIVK